ncbi:MAG: acyl-phosphate glycerol 3-phosphate acyltransferase [Bacteroidetes bacterium HGW-Bacteroidetes-11]|jgi:glycerol-3-phosphate acyltransferase PlsY|nr:MAG: acyl-phosphate glycerol 3-phosphate acyltransferase [Bacteroidetes bacterium HGW-Bacteroidetes-11]
MAYFYIAMAFILAYLLGSIPSSVWVGKWFYGLDIRNEGSGNAGATNTIRVLGLKAGIPVLLFDVFKAWLAVGIANWITYDGFSQNQEVIYRILLGAAAVIGHVYPVFAGFRGGKGVASLVGVVIALYPAAFLIILGCFIAVMVFTRTVSLASIISSLAFPVVVIFVFGETRVPLIILAVAVAVFVPYTHRENIKRLLNGTEKKFDFGKNKITKKMG